LTLDGGKLSPSLFPPPDVQLRGRCVDPRAGPKFLTKQLASIPRVKSCDAA